MSSFCQCARWTCVYAVLLAAALSAQTVSQAIAVSDPPPKPAPLDLKLSANELVRRAIDSQMQADQRPDAPRHMFTLRQDGKRGIITKEHVETDEGIVSRAIAVNDKPLTPQLEKGEQERLNAYLADPELRRKKMKQQEEDDRRTRNVVRALPDAFLYTYAGTTPGKSGDLVRLTFVPNPDFRPQSRELQALEGMAGSMLIEPRAMRLARSDARRVSDVNVGGGLLGKLNKGGEFMGEQQDIGAGVWRPTAMNLNFTGKALLFKTIKIRNRQTASNFRPVPQHLSFAQGVELLRRSNGETAAAGKSAR